MADNITLNAGTGGDTYAADDISGVKYARSKITLGADGVNDGDLSLTNPLPTLDELAIVRGKISTVTHLQLRGWNDDVDLAAVETVWSAGAGWVQPTTDRTHDVVSTSTSDTSAGTGARTVGVYGVSGGAITTETVTMNGTTPVSTANAYSWLQIYVDTAGSGGTNAGVITATAQTDSTVTSHIVTGEGDAGTGSFLVPSGTTARLRRWRGGHRKGSASTASCLFVIWYLPSGADKVWRPGPEVTAVNGTNPEFDLRLDFAFAAGAFLKVQATTGTDDTKVFSTLDFILDAG